VTRSTLGAMPALCAFCHATRSQGNTPNAEPGEGRRRVRRRDHDSLVMWGCQWGGVRLGARACLREWGRGGGGRMVGWWFGSVSDVVGWSK
jgi:hypothetical protein